MLANAARIPCPEGVFVRRRRVDGRTGGRSRLFYGEAAVNLPAF